MGARIDFQRSVSVPNGNYLLQVGRKKAGNRPTLFVLKYVPELVSQKAMCLMAAANEDRMAKC